MPRMTYADAQNYYGNDKPDTRFEMRLKQLNEIVKGQGFKVFDEAELVVAICAKGCAEYTRKQLDELTEWVKRPQIGATGIGGALRVNADGSLKSSVDKFYNEDVLKSGPRHATQVTATWYWYWRAKDKTPTQSHERAALEMGQRMGPATK